MGKKIDSILELEKLAGQAKEIVASYKGIDQKREQFSHIYDKLEEFAGQFSKTPTLMQSIRDLRHYCAILIDAEQHRDPIKNLKEYRSKILNFYTTLINECKKLKK